MKPWHLRWGATEQEAKSRLAGDEIIAAADLMATRGITIQASPDEVWPWIAQLGQGKGGFYSYDFIENLVGCDIHSAEDVIAEWQNLQAGDAVKLAPEVALTVAFVKPALALVLRGGVPMGKYAAPYDFTWSFVLKEAMDGSTRLLVRERYSYTRWWARLIVEPAEAVSFVMSQKMLHGIRNRVHQHPHSALRSRQ